MTQAGRPLRLRVASPADEADRAVLVRLADGELGDFTVGSDGTGTFEAPTPKLASGTVLALTREPTAGLTAPTGPVVSKGVATAPA